MKNRWFVFALFVTYLLAGTARADDANQSATAAEPGVVTKTGNAIEHGAHVTVEAVEKGARAAAHGVKRGVKAAAHGVEKAANAVGNAAGNVAKKVGVSEEPKHEESAAEVPKP